VCGSAPTNSMRQHAGMGRPARAGHTRTRRQDTQGRLAARHSARRWNGGRYVFRGEAAGQRPFVACRSGQVTSEAVGAAVLQALRFSLRIRRLGVRMPSGARCWLRQTPQVRAPERPHGPGLLRCPGPDRAQNGTAQDTQAEFLVIPETVPVSLHGLPWAQPAHHEGDGSGARAVPHLASADAASGRTVLTSLCHLGCTADVHLFNLE
jgi:hypothetical protein